MVTTLKRTH